MADLTPFERITLAVQAQIPIVRAMEAAMGPPAAPKRVRRARGKANPPKGAQRG